MRKTLYAVCLSVLLSGSVQADEHVTVRQMVDDIKSLSDKLRQQPPDISLKQLLPREKGKAEALGILKELQHSNADMRRMKQLNDSKSTYTNHEWLIFASVGMGKDEFQAVLEAASLQPDSVVVLRGIPKGAKLTDALIKIQAIAAQFDPVPNVVINPDLYKKHKVQSVPVVVKLTKREGRTSLPIEMARVSGLSDTVWLAQKLKEGRSGNFGKHGPLSQISEQDFVEAAKERVAGIDWTAQKEQASARFWERRRFYDLPHATQTRIRMVDPSFIVTADITAPDGQVIASRGQVINPLDLRPFPQAILVFDPLSRKQVERVKSLRQKLGADQSVSRVNYLATQIDKDRGWASYQSITDELQEHVYLLTPDVQRTFELEYTPSLITAVGGKFKVEEFGGDQ